MQYQIICLYLVILAVGCKKKQTNNANSDRENIISSSKESILDMDATFNVQANPKTNFYYKQGKKVYFEIVDEVAGIQLPESTYNSMMDGKSLISSLISSIPDNERFAMFNAMIVPKSQLKSILNEINIIEGDPPKYYPVMKKKDGSLAIVTNRVVMMFQKETSEERIAKIFDEVGISIDDTIYQNKTYRRYEFWNNNINGIDVSVKLETIKEVKYAHPDIIHGGIKDEQQPAATLPTSIQGQQHKLLNTQDVFDTGYIGNPNVSIGIIDDGFYLDHSEFGGKKIKEFNTYDNTNDASVDFNSDQTHGTPMAGAAVAAYEDGSGIYGTCPSCSLVAVKVINSVGNLGRLIYDELIEIDDLAIISMSISLYDYDTDLIEAFRTLHHDGRDNKGVLIFKSIGNENITIRDTTDLKLKDFVLTITGSDRSNFYRLGFSKCDSCIDFASLSSPVTTSGVAIGTSSINADYSNAKFTSGATALAAGVAGLVLGKSPSMTADQLENELINSAEKIVHRSGSNNIVSYDLQTNKSQYTGYGKINATSITNLSISTSNIQ